MPRNLAKDKAFWKARLGLVFSYLTVTGRDRFKCVCGKTYHRTYATVSRGRVKSCGCKSQELKVIGHTKHGMSKTSEYRMWAAARQRSRKEGRAFDLSLSDIIIPDVCPVFGILLDKQLSIGPRKDTSPSLDRFDSSKGYTKDNVRVISWRANWLKGKMTVTEARQIALYLRCDL
jgi:hypothetical protein